MGWWDTPAWEERRQAASCGGRTATGAHEASRLVALSSPTLDPAPAARVRPAPPAPRVGREAMLVGVAALGAYLLTLSSVPALTHDSLTYMEAIEQGGPALFHPHHLAYNVLARGWLDLTSAVGITADPLAWSPFSTRSSEPSWPGWCG